MNVEEMEPDHEKSLLALEQELEGWKSVNRILKAKLEQAEKALDDIACHGLYPAGTASIALDRIRGIKR